MRYGQVKKGVFLSRPNRFIAHVALDGVETVCHVKNTGRCRELLVPGAAVYLEKGTNPDRKTAYDLIAVEKNGKLINMDAQAPNKAFAEWALQFDPAATAVHSEYRFGQSRLDFCLETPQGLHLVEVKGGRQHRRLLLPRHAGQSGDRPPGGDQAIKQIMKKVQAYACTFFNR